MAQGCAANFQVLARLVTRDQAPSLPQAASRAPHVERQERHQGSSSPSPLRFHSLYVLHTMQHCCAALGSRVAPARCGAARSAPPALARPPPQHGKPSTSTCSLRASLQLRPVAAAARRGGSGAKRSKKSQRRCCRLGDAAVLVCAQGPTAAPALRWVNSDQHPRLSRLLRRPRPAPPRNTSVVPPLLPSFNPPQRGGGV